MISLSEEITIASPPEKVWPLLSDPEVVASCIPGATLTASGDGGSYKGSIRVKFGPTVAVFRGEAKVVYDHAARRCTIEGRGIDARGQSRANSSGIVTASGSDETLLSVQGNFNVTGPLETFANAGGVHLARALLAEFSQNIAKLIDDDGTPAPEAVAAPMGEPQGAVAPVAAESVAAQPAAAERRVATPRRPLAPAAELRAGSLVWRAFLDWVRHLFSAKGPRES
ncbi:MAG TPA: SRPBCC domain-containing protein [Stellaceae bacterium]|jgi:carbon monoxide dehydrogenase subunit G|nr:SRPBCC domain-containing protein [Stellaceae bacterium]